MVGCKRLPFGTLGGTLRNFSPPQLQEIVSRAALNAANVHPEVVDSVIVGCVMQWVSKDCRGVARQVSYRLGIPINASALIVNRACGSGFQSIISGAQQICLGESSIVLTGGSESMSLAPFTIRGMRYGMKLGETYTLEDTLWTGLTDWNIETTMGMTAENLAIKYKITRQECDEYALKSQERWREANNAGYFNEELTPVPVPTKHGDVMFTTDEHPRETTLEKLSKLPTVFKENGVVTAGNASGISDGAGAVLIAGEEAIKQHKLKPLARLVAYSVVGCDPYVMGIGPVPAIKKLCSRSGVKLKDVDLVEINEAFAPQYLAVEKELDLDPEKTNVHGGAIAIGHPLGASGSRITSHLVHELRRRRGKYGIGSACIGGGQGIALLLESIL